MTPEEGHWGERVKVMLLSLGDRWAIDSMFTRRKKKMVFQAEGPAWAKA